MSIRGARAGAIALWLGPTPRELALGVSDQTNGLPSDSTGKRLASSSH
jgi:hypothetical protein